MDDPEGFICFNSDEALEILRQFVTSSASKSKCRIIFVGHGIEPDDAEVSTVCLSICLSVCLSTYLSVCLSICVSIWLSLCIVYPRCRIIFDRHGIKPSDAEVNTVCLSINLCDYPSVCIAFSKCRIIFIGHEIKSNDAEVIIVCLCSCLSVCLSFCVCLSVYLFRSVYLSICFSILSACMSVWMYFCLSLPNPKYILVGHGIEPSDKNVSTARLSLCLYFFPSVYLWQRRRSMESFAKDSITQKLIPITTYIWTKIWVTVTTFI